MKKDPTTIKNLVRHYHYLIEIITIMTSPFKEEANVKISKLNAISVVFAGEVTGIVESVNISREVNFNSSGTCTHLDLNEIFDEIEIELFDLLRPRLIKRAKNIKEILDSHNIRY